MRSGTRSERARPERARAAIGLVARAERRERRWSLLALGLVLGLVGGLMLGAIALGERTGSAYSRLIDAVHLDDARLVLAADQPRTIAALPTMPGVADVWEASTYVVQLDGGALRFLSVVAGADPHPDLVTPVIVAGREPDPAAPDEVIVSEQLAEGSGMALGTEVGVRMLTLQDMADFAVGFTPHGPASRLRVVGIARMPAWGSALPDVVGGPGFARANAEGRVGTAAYLRLTPEPDSLARFSAALAASSAAEPSIVGEYLTATPETPRATKDESVVAAENALLVGIVMFAVVVGLGALQVTGLGLLRLAGLARGARSIEAALGMTAGESVLARVRAALPAAGISGLLGAGVVLAAGRLEPLGSQARFEPVTGFRPQWTLALLGGLGLAVVFLLCAAAAAAIAWRRAGASAAEPGSAEPRPSLLASVGAALRRRPTLLLGSRLARTAGARRGVPPLVTILAAAAAVAAIVATLVVGASLARLVDAPARWGGGTDLTIADSREDDVATLVPDPRVAALTVASTARLRTPEGVLLGAQSMVDRKGASPVQRVSGRLPEGPDEVAVNPRVATQFGLAEGSPLVLLGADGRSRELVVVGEAVVPSGERFRPGQDILLHPATLDALSGLRTPQLTAFVTAAPGMAGALTAELGGRLELGTNLPPEAIRNLADLVKLPGILAVVLAVVAGTGLVHSLLVTARRLAREMAVFSVLGATPGQVRTTLTVLAATTVVPAVLLGVPVGLGVARLFWWQVASTIGVGGDLAVPVWPILGLVLAVPVGAALVSVLPSLRVDRAATASALAAL
ncbi:hypothetical protein GCM10009836_27690 [Pseudonocardia ailaonensis]|uniref:ABC3 transporter permease C-terminal domain-containing protein n=1 Tax=Pseudonocardia ailaonensis TaxID=367279 RepID=A0ABN2N095_9PSEU